MPDLPSLDGLTSAQLAMLAEQVAAAYQQALEAEQKAQQTAKARLCDLAEQLGKQLGPEQPRQGNLLSLSEAALMSANELADKPGEVLHLIVTSLRDVTRLARDSVLIGAEQAH